jgi:hypothetical protein
MAYNSKRDKVRDGKSHRALRIARRIAAIAARNGCCAKCGSSTDLEFHHRNKEEKETRIAQVWSRSEKIREKELAKCDLLCAECHRVETSKERGYGKRPHGTITSYTTYNCRCKDCRRVWAEYARNQRKLKREKQ